MLIDRYKAIIFDFDDTLVKTHAIKWAQHKETAKRFYNLTLTDEDIIKFWGKPFDQMVSLLYNNIAPTEEIIEKYRLLDEQFPKQLQPGTLELLDSLSVKNIKTGIVTAMLRVDVSRDMKRLGFKSAELLTLQGAEDTNHHKPDPKVFEPTLEKLAQLGITNLETLYVGDAIRDLEAARGAGLGFVGITTGLTSMAEFEAENAVVINELKGLLEVD